MGISYSVLGTNCFTSAIYIIIYKTRYVCTYIFIFLCTLCVRSRAYMVGLAGIRQCQSTRAPCEEIGCSELFDIQHGWISGVYRVYCYFFRALTHASLFFHSCSVFTFVYGPSNTGIFRCSLALTREKLSWRSSFPIPFGSHHSHWWCI